MGAGSWSGGWCAPVGHSYQSRPVVAVNSRPKAEYVSVDDLNSLTVCQTRVFGDVAKALP